MKTPLIQTTSAKIDTSTSLHVMSFYIYQKLKITKALMSHFIFILVDHSRVRLSTIQGQKKTSDYINANFIDGYQKCNAYIGTQGMKRAR